MPEVSSEIAPEGPRDGRIARSVERNRPRTAPELYLDTPSAINLDQLISDTPSAINLDQASDFPPEGPGRVKSPEASSEIAPEGSREG